MSQINLDDDKNIQIITSILENSIYSYEQFTQIQLAALIKIVKSGISIEQTTIIANPAFSITTYTCLYNYLLRYPITSQELNNYISKNPDKINDIIYNVYVGKLRGLLDEQIELLFNPRVKNIKISRILIEKCKELDISTLTNLITVNFKLSSKYGELLIIDFLNDTISLQKLLLVKDYVDISKDLYDVLKTYNETNLEFLKQPQAIEDCGRSAKLLLNIFNEVKVYFIDARNVLDTLYKNNIKIQNDKVYVNLMFCFSRINEYRILKIIHNLSIMNKYLDDSIDWSFFIKDIRTTYLDQSTNRTEEFHGILLEYYCENNNCYNSESFYNVLTLQEFKDFYESNKKS